MDSSIYFRFPSAFVLRTYHLFSNLRFSFHAVDYFQKLLQTFPPALPSLIFTSICNTNMNIISFEWRCSQNILDSNLSNIFYNVIQEMKVEGKMSRFAVFSKYILYQLFQSCNILRHLHNLFTAHFSFTFLLICLHIGSDCFVCTIGISA